MYNPITDFLALLRNVNNQATVSQVPGLDFVISAMARAGMFNLYVGQTAPIVNQATTVWLKPSVPSWVAEGVVYLWNAADAQYEVATPALWDAVLLASVSGQFQLVTGNTATVDADTTLIAIERSNPAATTLTLPPVADKSKPLQVVDWSSNVVAHQITLVPDGTEKIMRLSTFRLFSTPDQLAGVTLYPSTDLAGWVIAP